MTEAANVPALPAILTTWEAAEYLRVSPRTLYSMTRPRGPIPCIRVGPRGVRYTMAALQQWIEDQQSSEGYTDTCTTPGGSAEVNGRPA